MMDEWIGQNATLNRLASQNHLWLFDTPSLSEYCHDRSMLLTSHEAARWRSLRLPADQEAFLVRRVLLRTLIGAYLGLPPESFTIMEAEGRKPSLADQTQGPLEFSVSRSGPAIAIAFSQHPVGIDLELVRAFPDIDELLGSCCTVEEARALRHAPTHRFWDRFFQLWSGKEAVAKALGLGLSLNFSSFSLPEGSYGFKNPAAITDLDPGGRSVWLGIQSIDPSPHERWMIAHACLGPYREPTILQSPT